MPPNQRMKPTTLSSFLLETVFGFVALQAKLGHTAKAAWRLMRGSLACSVQYEDA